MIEKNTYTFGHLKYIHILHLSDCSQKSEEKVR